MGDHDLVQDTQRVVMSSEAILRLASNYYANKTGKQFKGDFYNYRWNEQYKTLEITAVTNHKQEGP